MYLIIKKQILCFHAYPIVTVRLLTVLNRLSFFLLSNVYTPSRADILFFNY